jgi:membrane protein
MFVDFTGSVILSYVISYLYKTSVIHHKFMNIIFLNVLPFIINFLAIAIFVIALYKYLIPIKIRFKKVYASAFLVTVAWYVLTFALRISFGLSKNTPVIYGTFSNIYMILVWLYSVSFVFILGIILNYYLYLKAGKKSEE